MDRLDPLNGASCTAFSRFVSPGRLPNLWSSDQTFVIWPPGEAAKMEGGRGRMSRREVL